MRQLKIFGAVLAATLSIVGCGQLPSQSPSTQSYDYDYGYSYSTPAVTQTNAIGAATQVSGNDSVLVQKNAAGAPVDATQTNVIGAATQVSGHNSVLIQKNTARRHDYNNTY